MFWTFRLIPLWRWTWQNQEVKTQEVFSSSFIPSFSSTKTTLYSCKKLHGKWNWSSVVTWAVALSFSLKNFKVYLCLNETVMSSSTVKPCLFVVGVSYFNLVAIEVCFYSWWPHFCKCFSCRPLKIVCLQQMRLVSQSSNVGSLWPQSS